MYILRLDDASEHWNKENWLQMHDLLAKYDVKPIVAVIPHNEDAKLLKYSSWAAGYKRIYNAARC